AGRHHRYLHHHWLLLGLAAIAELGFISNSSFAGHHAGSPALMAASCLRATSRTTSAGTGSFGGLLNSITVKTLPSVNNTIPTDWEPSGAGPMTMLPRVPTSTGVSGPFPPMAGSPTLLAIPSSACPAEVASG